MKRSLVGRTNLILLAVAVVGVIGVLLVLTERARTPANGPPASADSAARRFPPPRLAYVETAPLRIDRIYTSMEGPSDRIVVNSSDIDWITAFKTEVIDTETNQPMGEEFFCHSQLQLNTTTRLMVAATGSSEIRFPPGFAMPVTRIIKGQPAGSRTISFLGMVLNNHVPDIDRTARVRASIEYYRDEDFGAEPPPRKIYKVGLPMTVEDLESYHPRPGDDAIDDVSTHCVLVEGQPVHWLVPPGHQVTRREFDSIVPVESTVHLAITHLHNWADYLRLTDLTTEQTLFQTDVIYEEKRKQISEIPAYSSQAGFKIYPDHSYQIEVAYTNGLDRDIDAMAVIDLYYHPEGNPDISYGQ